MDQRLRLQLNLDEDEERVMTDLVKVGTSAGGQRPKAVIAFNKKTREIRSGQFELPVGFEHFLIKFDGVRKGNLADPQGYGRIELAYYHMAKNCGIDMTPSKLLEENGRAHFMTKRFDRINHNEKVHVQTLCAIAHYDYRMPGAYSYEGAFAEMRDLDLPYQDFDQMFRRMIFNVVARNQDDHTKNISFMLEKDKEWRLSPAYDMSWSFNPRGEWTNSHQMTINNKRDNFLKSDLLTFGKIQNIKKAGETIERTIGIIEKWPEYAKETGVDKDRIEVVRKTHRLKLDGIS